MVVDDDDDDDNNNPLTGKIRFLCSLEHLFPSLDAPLFAYPYAYTFTQLVISVTILKYESVDNRFLQRMKFLMFKE
jgi:hypothetical protein